MTAKRNIIPVFVPHLGCPNNCVFCNQRKISGESVPADGGAVTRALTEGLSKSSAPSNIELAFYGGSFTAIPVAAQTALLDAALPFFRDGRISGVRLSTRPDAIDAETLNRLRVYGVKTIELGAQSMCDEVLAASGRGHTAEQTRAAARQIRAAGFALILQMMTGLPGDTKTRTLETARELIALKPDAVRIYPTVVITDTPLYDLWRAGRYPAHTVEQAVDWCAAILPLFAAAEIPVIRLGLNPTEALSGGEAAAGAYHPAFGELVQSRLLLKKAAALLSENPRCVEPVLRVHPGDVSAMVGQKRENLKTLCTRFGFDRVRVSAADVKKGTVELG